MTASNSLNVDFHILFFLEFKKKKIVINPLIISKLQDILFSLTIAVLRNDLYYFFAITPYEILHNYDLNLKDHFEYKLNRVPSIPIDYLNEADMVEKFVKRINIVGFRTRQHFEEFFMSLLLLINKESDCDMVGEYWKNYLFIHILGIS